MKSCLDVNVSEDSHRFHVSNSCALFDFIVYTVAMGTLSILGLVGNAVSFLVLLRDRGRSATSFLLQALAFVDSLVLVTAVPLYILPAVYPYTGFLASYYHVYLTILPVLWPIYLIPYTCTVIITVLVSLHRYCSVCKPFRQWKVFTCREARNRVAGITIFSVIYNIPRFFEYQSVQVCLAPNVSRSAFEISELGNNKFYRILYANVMYFLVIHGGPLLLITFVNVQLILALKRRQQRWAEMGKGWYQQDVSLVLVVVMCVFIVCQTPTFIDHILWTVIGEEARQCGGWHYYYTAIGDLLAILNSSVNFVIYILTSRNFRRGLLTQSFGARNEYVGLHNVGLRQGQRCAAPSTQITLNKV